MYMERFTAFTINLSNIERSLHKIKSMKMAQYGLRATHLMCMAQIESSKDGLTPTQIAQECAIDKAFVSRITNDLIAQSFIQINDKFNDGRKYRQKYILTEKGYAVMEEVKEIIDKVIANIRGTVSADELKCFYKVLDVINKNINSVDLEDNLNCDKLTEKEGI